MIEFSNYFTNNYSGLTIEEAHQKINNEIIDTKKRMFDLMQSAMDTSNLESNENIFISGKENLIDNEELTKDLVGLKKIINLFDKKMLSWPFWKKAKAPLVCKYLLVRSLATMVLMNVALSPHLMRLMARLLAH